MLDRVFRLTENRTTVRTELLAGLTTFLTMAYIIVVQPTELAKAVPKDLELLRQEYFGAVMTATCLAAALATLIMGLYARYPIAQAPGMGENFFFVALLLMLQKQGYTVAESWQTGLGVVFLSGVLFLALSLFGVREALMDSISPSMRHGIAVGIGLLIAFFGLHNGTLIEFPPSTGVRMNPKFASPDLLIFLAGVLLTAVLHALRVRGAIIWGMLGTAAVSFGLLHVLPRLPEQVANAPLVVESKLLTDFAKAEDAVWGKGLVAPPPSLAPTLGQLNLRDALSPPMIPFVFIFLFMVLFDTLGTLIGVCERAGLIKDNRLPRARQALMSDAIGTVAGAAMGTSTVTSFVESAAGVEQGGRTGLTALVVAALFLLALPFSPLVALLGSYPPITAPALVVVGSMMMANVVKIDWSNYAESLPAFLVIAGIPLSYSIADGLALGFIAYPIVKLAAGQGRDVKWLMYVMAAVLVAYFLFVRAQTA
jgi:AGZA family xanthine/uracil permease-like MFS transporter